MADSTATELVHRFVDYLCTGDDAIVEETFSPDHHDHVSGRRGRDIYRTVRRWIEGTIDEIRLDIHAVMSEDDRVMVWVTLRGRHIGNAFPFLADRPVTGRELAAEAVHIFRVADGKLTEHWAVRDDLALIRQIDS